MVWIGAAVADRDPLRRPSTRTSPGCQPADHTVRPADQERRRRRPPGDQRRTGTHRRIEPARFSPTTASGVRDLRNPNSYPTSSRTAAACRIATRRQVHDRYKDAHRECVTASRHFICGMAPRCNDISNDRISPPRWPWSSAARASEWALIGRLSLAWATGSSPGGLGLLRSNTAIGPVLDESVGGPVGNGEAAALRGPVT